MIKKRVFDSAYRSKWNANTPEREQKILRLLEEEDMGFEELHNKLRWSRQTLNLYLKALRKKGYIRLEEKGRRAINSLIRNNPDVARMLGWDRIPPDIRIRGRIELDKLDEEKFIEQWLNSVEFAFLNIIQDFMLIGERSEEADDNKTIRRLLAAHTQDLVEAVTFLGEVMAKRVRLGTLKPEKIWGVRNKMLKQIRDESE